MSFGILVVDNYMHDQMGCGFDPMWLFNVFMYYKCPEKIMYSWKKQTYLRSRKATNYQNKHSLENHTHIQKERLSTLPVKLALIWTSAMWRLTCAPSLCPGLAAPGALCWALPSPSSFPVAPQAPPKEECGFQVCKNLAS